MLCLQLNNKSIGLRYLLFVAKEDLLALKKLIKKYSSFDIPIISKIEKPQALTTLMKLLIKYWFDGGSR